MLIDNLNLCESILEVSFVGILQLILYVVLEIGICIASGIQS